MSSSVAESYATALLEVAQTTNTLETTSADLEKLDSVFADPQVVDYFSNPIITDEKKKSFVDEIAKSLSLQQHVSNFLNIIIDGQRVNSVSEIVREFEAAYNRLTDTELALVSSVVTLESQHLAQIAKQVQKLTGAKNVRIKTSLDPSLVAGFTVRYGSSGSRMIDMSVKKQLEEIAAQLEVGDIQLAV
ncbi:ATP synthase subunit delta, chloroplastic [Linum perenne]